MKKDRVGVAEPSFYVRLQCGSAQYGCTECKCWYTPWDGVSTAGVIVWVRDTVPLQSQQRKKKDTKKRS